MIRKGKEISYVEACIYLPENKNSIDGNIIVSREIYSNGRNLCKINGRMVTVNELKEFMKNIIDIHGQHDNQSLLDSKTHIEYLDNFSYKEINAIKEEYKELYKQYNSINIELKNNFGNDKEKQRELDLLQYQFNEIQKANLKIGEDKELEEKRTILLNSEKIKESLNVADLEISENTIDSITKGIKALEKIEYLDNNYSQKLNTLKSIYYDLQEVARDISNLREDMFFDEDERVNIENRLDTIFSLKRKYGNTLEEILNYKDELYIRINKIENLEQHNNKLKQELKEIKFKMQEKSKEINKIRKKNGIELEKKINSELYDLEMKNAKFSIKIEFSQNEQYNKNGLDEVEFLISTNTGEDFKPLTKIASGGEMSRIMLAIKNVLANVDIVPILVFDEIDTGISGVAAKSVGEKLKSISKMHQVLCVTHLANIAAKGDYNYFINKKVINNTTNTNIRLLNEDETINEIARIASGEITEIALNHAKELRKIK